jgi:hypothetical protein
LNFYLTTDTTTNIQPVTSPLAYNTGALPEGLGMQLSPHFLLGSGTFNTTGDVNNGQVDNYTFSLTAAEIAYIKGQLGNGPLRFVITPTDPNVSATFAGFSNNEFAGPTLTFVPEPTSVVLAGIGIAGLVCFGWRRMRAA